MSVHSVHSLSIYRTETFNNFELNLIVSDIRRHLVSIRVMHNFNMYTSSTRREVLYIILIEFGVPKKLVRLIKMCLTETYSRVRVGKNLSVSY